MYDLKKYYATFLHWLQLGLYTITPEGIILNGKVAARGTYYPFIDGQLTNPEHNLVPLEALRYFLQVGLNNQAAETTWYLALFSGAVDPASNWTAANFAANASEITDPTEGYSNATRPQWVPGTMTGSIMDNLNSLATYNIVCTTSCNISGAALLSSDVKGGASGVLGSASRFNAVQVVNNGSTFELGYEIELTDS